LATALRREIQHPAKKKPSKSLTQSELIMNLPVNTRETLCGAADSSGDHGLNMESKLAGGWRLAGGGDIYLYYLHKIKIRNEYPSGIGRLGHSDLIDVPEWHVADDSDCSHFCAL
jgi:hypothetical protein